MKRINLKIYFILLLHIAGSFILQGQKKPIQDDESIYLFSDRSLYIAGEKILFSAFLQAEDNPNQENTARVLYCELVTPGGNKIVSNKYLIENYFASGDLPVPNDITTGIYYLRAYTRYMRNRGPSSYHYARIRIVNANKSDVQTTEENINPSETLFYEEIHTIPENLFLITTNKSKYAPRDTVFFSIAGNEAIQSSFKDLNLAVVPEFSTSTDIVSFPDNGQLEKKVFYYSETHGLSITGKLTDDKEGFSLPGARVNLTIIGRGGDFMAVQTDSAGRFFFSLPDYTGYRDLFLCAENTTISDTKFLIDNDFCSSPVHIPSQLFTLTNQQRETAFKMAVNVQLESYFNDDSIPAAGNNKLDDKAFYGTPNEILYVDNYVNLPTLEEYFNGLPSLVRVRKNQGEKYFKLFGTQTGLNDFDPLVLVDLVAIDDVSKILAIPPTLISRIEVVNMRYVKGDQIYGGIISIITKHNDFAGIDLPSSGIFINYCFLAESISHSVINSSQLNFPDTRNTLYWEPHLVLDTFMRGKIEFLTPDTPGRYLIVLSGIQINGEVFRQTSPFEVMR